MSHPTTTSRLCLRLLLLACAGIARPFRADGPLRCGQPGYSIIALRTPHARATEDDVEEARRFLDLAADPDVERYLRDGKSALGRQAALVLPRDDAGVEAAMMLAARKLVKLGASVRVVKPEADPRQLSGAARHGDMSRGDCRLGVRENTQSSNGRRGHLQGHLPLSWRITRRVTDELRASPWPPLNHTWAARR